MSREILKAHFTRRRVGKEIKRHGNGCIKDRNLAILNSGQKNNDENQIIIGSYGVGST